LRQFSIVGPELVELVEAWFKDDAGIKDDGTVCEVVVIW
jgi:hypothetical protein